MLKELCFDTVQGESSPMSGLHLQSSSMGPTSEWAAPLMLLSSYDLASGPILHSTNLHSLFVKKSMVKTPSKFKAVQTRARIICRAHFLHPLPINKTIHKETFPAVHPLTDMFLCGAHGIVCICSWENIDP